MAYKRREHDRACRCDQADAGCAALAVQRLSRTRVQELAEEIWTLSTGTIAPVQPILDPRSSRPGASAQATYQRRRHKEREQWRDGWRWRWRSALVAAAVPGVGLLVGRSMGVRLGWRMALLAGLLVWWRLRVHPSANARSGDGRPRRRETTGRSVVGGPRPDLSWKAEAIADSLAGTGIPVRRLLCLHVGIRPPGRRAVQGIPLVVLRRLPDVVRHGSRVQPIQSERASARALEVLRPAA
jgi:hypothetical protein